MYASKRGLFKKSIYFEFLIIFLKETAQLTRMYEGALVRALDRKHGMSEPEEFIPTRQSLLSRLKDWSDQESWRVFFETYWRVIYRAARQAGLSDAEAQDVVQETLISVSRNIKKFKYDPAKGSFKTWLMRMANWRVQSQLRKRLPTQSAAAGAEKYMGTAMLEGLADPAAPELEAIWDKEWKDDMLETAMKRVKAKANPKRYQIFDLVVRKKWPPSRVAADLKTNIANVYFAKHYIGRLIQKEIARLDRDPFGHA